jgi:hypothetical protein
MMPTIEYSFSGYDGGSAGTAQLAVYGSRCGWRPLAFQMLSASVDGQRVNNPSEAFAHLYKWLMNNHIDWIEALWKTKQSELSTGNADISAADVKKCA